MAAVRGSTRMMEYTLGLFANMYPAFEGDYRGIFIRQMVHDLEARGVMVHKAVKTTGSPVGYIPFYCNSLFLSRNHCLDLMQAEYIPHSSIIPAVFGRRDIPFVLKFHGDDARIYPQKNRLYGRITRSMLKRAAYVITASREMQKSLIPFGLDTSRCSAIHTGVDTDFFIPQPRDASRMALGIPDDQTVFLFVGRLHPWKGVGEIIRVARECPRFRFVFAGPGEVPDHPENCRFTGPLDRTVIRAWLNAADCLLLPTYTEAVPASVMEAFSCGIPAITSDAGGCPEIVTDGKNGILVPPRDVVRLKEAAEWMHDNPGGRLRMGSCARATVTEQYDHNILTDNLVRVHRQLIEGR